MTVRQLSGVDGTVRMLARAGLLVAGLLLAGCQTDGGPLASAGSTAAPGPNAVAFDLIEGAPRPTFDTLVASLTTAAGAYKVDAVSRTEDPPYRVKGTLGIAQAKGKASVAYVWDVYDRDGAKIASLKGEEPLGTVKKGTDPWTVCDAAVLDKIADRTMAELAETVSGGAPNAVAAAQAPQGAGSPAQPAPAAASPAAAVHSAGLAPTTEPAPRASLAYAIR